MNTYNNNVIYLDRITKKNYKKDFKPILYMLIGIPCSGKSHYAKENCNKLDAEIVSSDDIRIELKGDYEFSTEDNKRVFKIIHDRIENTLIEGKNVILDATNTNKKSRKKYINLAHKCDARIIAVVFKTPFRICVKRNEQREHNKRIPIESLKFYNRSNLDIKIDEGFDDVEHVEFDL